MLDTNGDPLWLTPDAFADESISSVSLNGTTLTVTVGIINLGDAAFSAPIYVTLYKNIIDSDSIITTVSENIQIAVDDTVYVTLTIPNMTLYKTAINLIVRVNDNNGAFPVHPECRYDNNTFTFINPALRLWMQKDATLLLSPPVTDRGTYPNPVAVLYDERIEYKISVVNSNFSNGTTVIIRDTLPLYLDFVSSVPPITPPSVPYGTRQPLAWTLTNIASFADTAVTFTAKTFDGVNASQPLFVNRAWVTVSDTIELPTNETYHQGAGVSITTFSADFGGQIYNAEPQAVDFKTSARTGIVVVPNEGYRFAGWRHTGYISLRGETIPAQNGIMLYDTLTIYGNVHLYASFVLERYPINYYLNGGENVFDNPLTYTVESGDITLNEPAKTLDVFIGWTGSNGDEPQMPVTIPAGSTGERTFYANFQHSGREKRALDDTPNEEKIWVFENDLYIHTFKTGSVVRIYSTNGVLCKVQSIITAGETIIKLPSGIYVVTLNNNTGKKVIIK
jgi:uncharacterized repeat protein (TIGR02543 family)/uncharacterized repeat protein (TIGR01451 family)